MLIDPRQSLLQPLVRVADEAAEQLALAQAEPVRLHDGGHVRARREQVGRLGDGLDVNAVESCTSYNTLKISRALFSWSLDAGFLDSYERLKFSGMFGTMHPTAPGRILYMLPIDSTGVAKAHSYYGWSDPTDSMWCCSGSGMESGASCAITRALAEPT